MDLVKRVVALEQQLNEIRNLLVASGVITSSTAIAVPPIDFVLVPGGTFTMGAPEDEEGSNDSERPQHQVTIQPFFMSKYLITQEQYQAVMGKNPSDFKGEKRPVEKVSWDDAMEFCKKLSQKTGRNYRLPSEAEWEYACRAGTTTPFHFGDNITTDLVNYDGDFTYKGSSTGECRDITTDVGSFPPNAFGLHDMHGNILEYCLDDWHSNYENAPTDGSPWFDDEDNLSQKTGRVVLRGGSWCSNPKSCRSAYRDSNIRAGRGFIFNDVGFRVVCE